MNGGSERFAGCSTWSSSTVATSEEARHTLWYVEPLNDARTKLAGFFSILLESIEKVGRVNTALVNDQRVTTDYILVTREWRAIRLESYQQMP